MPSTAKPGLRSSQQFTKTRPELQQRESRPQTEDGSRTRYSSALGAQTSNLQASKQHFNPIGFSSQTLLKSKKKPMTGQTNPTGSAEQSCIQLNNSFERKKEKMYNTERP